MNKLTTYLTFISYAFIGSQTLAANVVSASDESFAQYGKEDAYWVMSVTCDDNNGERIVQRKTDEDTWCPKGNTNLCSEDKTIAQKNSCGDSYTATLIAIKAQQEQQARQRRETQNAQRLEAQRQQELEKAAIEQKIREEELKIQNKIALEEQILAIEQERLDLTTRELEIENRLIEIDRLIQRAEDDI